MDIRELETGGVALRGVTGLLGVTDFLPSSDYLDMGVLMIGDGERSM
jgi:hypothetical protein